MAPVASAFPGSIEEESVPLEAFHTVEGEQDRAMMDVTEDAIQQETELDEVGIPNLRRYVSQSEGYIGNLAMFHKRFC